MASALSSKALQVYLNRWAHTRLHSRVTIRFYYTKTPPSSCYSQSSNPTQSHIKLANTRHSSSKSLPSNSLCQPRNPTSTRLSSGFLAPWSAACLPRHLSSLQYVPPHQPCSAEELQALQQFVDGCSRLFVITGAGISTESGIPDYRSEGVGLYATSNRRPMVIKEFLSAPAARQRYWARSMVAWPRLAPVTPNAAHLALAGAGGPGGRLAHVCTQNVDGLHGKAGQPNVTELHGRLAVVRCMTCEYRVDRNAFQLKLRHANPHLTRSSAALRPDGDVELTEDEVSGFTVPSCPSCDGVLKPDVVFFGESVPRARVQRAMAALEGCDAVLVCGTSLQVFSAYRFVLRAAELGLPLAVVNIGATRGDSLMTLRVAARCGDVLPLLRWATPKRGRQTECVCV